MCIRAFMLAVPPVILCYAREFIGSISHHRTSLVEGIQLSIMIQDFSLTVEI